MRRRDAIALAVLSTAAIVPASAQDTEAMLARARALTAARTCPPENADAIVVCGRADPTARYRLPLPVERDAAPLHERGGLAATEILNVPGTCGPSGTRRCTRREALSQGLGGGRDALSLGLRLAGRLLDPDADLAPPPE